MYKIYNKFLIIFSIFVFLLILLGSIIYYYAKGDDTLLSIILNKWEDIIKNSFISTVIINNFIIKVFCLKYISKFLQIPYIDGNWKGKIIYEFQNEKFEKEVNVKIIQSFTNIAIVVESESMTSKSITANIVIDDNTKISYLEYLYECVPNQLCREKNPIHFGATRLRINDDKTNIKMQGEYWTSRKTVGEMIIYA